MASDPTPTTEVIAQAQREMQHRAAEAVVRSSIGKGCSEEQHKLLAEAAEAVLALDIRT